MNEENQTVDVVENDNKVVAEPEKQSLDPKDEKKYTDADVDKIIDKKFAKWKKELEAEKSEAEKLRKMNEKEKADYEAKKQADYIAELEAKINRTGLEKEASKMLSGAGIVPDEAMLNFVVGDDAEQTIDKVNAFTKLVKAVADKQVSEMLKGKTPARIDNHTSGQVTKAQFTKMGYAQRLQLKETDPSLYEQLKGE